MSEVGRHKLSDAIPRPQQEPGHAKGGKPKPTPESTGEQVRESQESEEARLADASNRERMVDIGRGSRASEVG